jgi:hypothetical protein
LALSFCANNLALPSSYFALQIGHCPMNFSASSQDSGLVLFANIKQKYNIQKPEKCQDAK